MKLKIRAVRIRVETRSGPFGATVKFGSGFNIIRGANSRGKTQVVQAIIYALGMERMLQARANAPLGSAINSEIRTGSDEGTAPIPVESSWVAVEFANEAGRIVTAQRFVKHEEFRQNLVRVWEGPALTVDSKGLARTDYFLHQSGGASRDLGFHHLLTQMLGWELPSVSTYGAQPSLLYPDVVFPFLLVDQQSWGSAAPRKVDRYQIRQPLRRAVEFLLDLRGPEAEESRDRLEREIAELRSAWAADRTGLEALASAVGGRMTGVPVNAAGAQARTDKPEPTSLASARLELLESGEWVDAASVERDLQDQLTLLSQQTRAAAEPAEDKTTRELALAKEELADVLAAAQLMDHDLSSSEAQLAALDRRLQGLSEERDRNSDVRTLVRLGSDVAGLHAADDNCPTCRQSLVPVEASELGPVLDVDETIALLNAQITTTQRMRVRTQATADEANSAYAALQRQADQLRAQIRAHESDLVAPDSAPREGEIARRVTIQLRLDDLSRATAAFAERVMRLEQTAGLLAQARGAFSELPSGIPESDIARLEELKRLMRSRLSATNFDSYPVSEVSLDQDSLRPGRAGFDVDTDVSASDVVRVKTAYLDAVRCLGEEVGRHPGLLVLDEPRQQDIQEADFAAMLRYLANADVDGGQVIVTSATPIEDLQSMLGVDVAVHAVDLGEARLLQPVVEDSLGF